MTDKHRLFAIIIAVVYVILSIYYNNKSKEDKEERNHNYMCTVIVTSQQYSKEEHEYIKKVDTVSFFMSHNDHIVYQRISNVLKTKPNDHLFIENVSDYRIIEKTIISSEETSLP